MRADHSILGERYAGSLFALAQEQGKRGEVLDGLERFAALVSEHRVMRSVLNNPTLRGDKVALGLRDVLARIDLDPLVSRFLRVVARNRRLFAFDAIVESYRALEREARGDGLAEVTSAHPLSDAQQARLQKALTKQYGGHFSLDLRVDPNLIGGLRLRLDSRMLDATLRRRLETIKNALNEVV